MKRIVSLILAFLLVFGSVPVYAAEKTGISFSEEKISAGESVALKIALPEDLPNVLYLEIEVDYDQDVFNITKSHAGWVFADSDIPGTAKGNYSANDVFEGDKLAGTVLEFTFTAEADAEYGEYDFTVRLSGSDAYFEPLDIEGGVAKVKIGGISVEGISITEENAEIFIGETVQLTANVFPDNAENKNIIWSTSDDNYASVDENGIVSGINRGVVTITATTEDGGFSDSCEVTVKCAHSNKVYNSASEPDCYKVGWNEHWNCPDCGANLDMELNEVDNSEVYIPYTDHKWKVSYKWSDDYSSCVATKVCENNNHHELADQEIVSETANATVPIISKIKSMISGAVISPYPSANIYIRKNPVCKGRTAWKARSNASTRPAF